MECGGRALLRRGVRAAAVRPRPRNKSPVSLIYTYESGSNLGVLPIRRGFEPDAEMSAMGSPARAQCRRAAGLRVGRSALRSTFMVGREWLAEEGTRK